MFGTVQYSEKFIHSLTEIAHVYMVTRITYIYLTQVRNSTAIPKNALPKQISQKAFHNKRHPILGQITIDTNWPNFVATKIL